MHLLKRLKKQESGSIMLEVVAVLALMGVMGAMLFRQVYQRNQELHNIQMASEIRTVKEAFSAYIKANKAELGHKCIIGGMVEGTNLCADEHTSNNFLKGQVAQYLPEGWFGDTEHTTLGDAYTFYLYTYMDDSDRQVVYGLVVPTEATLPETGWNFKRAARVALLIGADGGAYDSDITGGALYGSLGSWEIPTDGVDLPKDSGNNTIPIYAATTGIDIFAPEYEPPEGKVNLKDDWDLALQNLHAYRTFSVGNSVTADSDCYDIYHTGTNGPVGNESIANDTIKSIGDKCRPLFWVEDTATGKVNVATDLNIGEVVNDGGTYKHNEALKLTKEGRVIQKNGLTIGTDGRIIAHDGVSRGIGDLTQGEPYVLDPAYTSTMNDIRLTSRGGIRLSEILPNYILKDQHNINCTLNTATGWCSSAIQVKKPSCPGNYKIALVVIPTGFGEKMVNETVVLSGHTASAGGHAAGDSADPHNHNLTGDDATATATASVHQFQIMINNVGDLPVEGESQANNNWSVQMGYGTAINSAETVYAIAQTYCVFDSGVYGTQEDCNAAGWKWDATKNPRCTSTRLTDAARVGILERTQQSCQEGGYEWDSIKNRCTGKYAEPITISGYSDPSIKAKACKAAGFILNGSTCSAPSNGGG